MMSKKFSSYAARVGEEERGQTVRGAASADEVVVALRAQLKLAADRLVEAEKIIQDAAVMAPFSNAAEILPVRWAARDYVRRHDLPKGDLR